MSNVLNHPMEWELIRARDVAYVDLGISETLESFPWRYLTESAEDHELPEEIEFSFDFAYRRISVSDYKRADAAARISEAYDVPTIELVRA